MIEKRRLRRSLPLLVALAVAACATGDGRVASADPPGARLDPWCEREIRAAESQPVPRDATAEEARILRDRHLSQACARAWHESRSVTVPITGRDRIPDPLPRRRPD